MPHLILSCFPSIECPFVDGAYSFMECFDDIHNHSKLLWICYEQKSFFLTLYHKDSKVIIKPHKQSSITSTHIFQGALKILKKRFIHCVCYDNLAQNHGMSMNSPYILDYQQLLALITHSSKPILLEIGFGSGRRILEQASIKPDSLCIGVEIYDPSIQQVVKHIQLHKLSNVYLIKADARLLLEILPSHSLTEIALHFPVPWPKASRRVFSRAFFMQAKRVLKKGAKLHLRTDDESYFYDCLHILGTEIQSCEISKNRPLNIISKYEERWLKQKKDIWDVIWECSCDYPYHKPIHDVKWSFDEFETYAKIIEDFVPYKRCEDGIVLSVSHAYKGQADSVILGLCLGHVYCPQNVFLLMSQAMTCYCPPLLPIDANVQAHRWLREWRGSL